MLKQQLKNSEKAKYEIGHFCEKCGLPPIAPSRQKRNKRQDKAHKNYKYKRYKRCFTKTSKRNMISRNMVKETVSIAGNLVTLVKTANKNLVN